MGKKTKKKAQAEAPTAAGDTKEAAEKPAAEATKEQLADGKVKQKKPKPGTEAPAKAEKKAGSKDAVDAPKDDASQYHASAVIFFTRNASDGSVAKVLVAVEERRVDAKWIGLEGEKGKVFKRMVVFPMGRRERKDHGDMVETAKREYIEETTDFGGLSRYLDFADFREEGEEVAAEQRDPKSPHWTGADNMAIYFLPAGMAVLFCEVLPQEAERPQESASGKSEEELPKKKAETALATQANGTSKEEPPKKKAKTVIEKPTGNPSYHVGKTDHVKPFWIDVAELKDAATSLGRAPPLRLNGEECYWFPTCVSILRMEESRKWMRLAGAESAAKTADAKTVA